MADVSSSWIDSHCHLPAEAAERSTLLQEAAAAGVTGVVTVGCDVASSEVCAAAAAEAAAAAGSARPSGGERTSSAAGVAVWATAGVHPHDARTVVDPDSGAVDLRAIEALLDRPGVVGVGECGLDYHYDHSPRDQQRQVFAAQVALAHRRRLALVIHTREAWDDTFAILESEGVPERTVFHCFTGGPDEARRGLDLGIRLSVSGIVTFPSAADLRAAVELAPLDRLLVETDSPYLAPVPHRGRRNRPALVTLVGAAVAEVKGLPVPAVAGATAAGAAALFRLDATTVT
jgi:TatD DNase family protein